MSAVPLSQRWRFRAACRGVNPEVFFPEIGENATEAKAVCAACPVKADCLAHAVSIPERHGIFGGLSAKERRGMRPPGRCRRGLHLMTPDNTYTEPASGDKRCKACRAESRLRRRQVAARSKTPQPRELAAA